MWVSINHGDHGQMKVQRVSRGSSSKIEGGEGGRSRGNGRVCRRETIFEHRETEIGGRSIDSIRIAEIILQLRLRMRRFRLFN